MSGRRDDDEMEIDSHQIEEAYTKQGALVAKSIEGYVIIASNIHEEATEEDVLDFFENYGKVKNLHLNLDRQTGYVRGYALVEYVKLEDAVRAVKESLEEELLGNIPSVDFAFVAEPIEDRGRSEGDNEDGGYVRRRDRSRSRE